MINDLRLDQIDIAAAAEIKDASLPSFAFGQPIEGGDFKLNVSAERLTLQGTAKLAGIPTRLRWQENFRSDAPVARHYEASGKIPVAELEKFGVSGLSPYVDGTLATDIAYMKTSAGPVDIVVKADLGEASLFVPGFDWRKQPGEKGVAWFAVSVAEDGAAEVRKFDVQARDLRARGHAKLSAKGSLQTLKLDQFDLGRTRTVATIAVDRNGLLRYCAQRAGVRCDEIHRTRGGRRRHRTPAASSEHGIRPRLVRPRYASRDAKGGFVV